MSVIASMQVQSDLSDSIAMKTERDTPTTCSPSSECDLSIFDKDGCDGSFETTSIGMSGDELVSTDMDDEATSVMTPRSDRSRCSSAQDEDILAKSVQSNSEEHFLAVVYPIAMLLQLRVACCGARAGSACKCQPAVRYSSKPELELPECFRRGREEANSAAPAWRSAAAAFKAGKGKAGGASNNKRGSNSEPQPKPHGPKPSLPPTSSNSWAAQQQAAKAQSDDEDKNIVRQARSILNKLTIEKFDRLYEQLADCGVRTEAHVAMIMHEVFEKATLQHHFIPMYADLCVQLERDPRIVPAMEAEGTSKGFRGLLLNQCQSAFEGMLHARGTGPQDEEDEEAKSLRKSKALGNVKFVGELIVRGMLCTRLLCNIGEDLIASRNGCVDALESLAALMTVACPKFDNKQWMHYERLDAIFGKVKELTSDKTVPARIRFLLRDVLDLRKAGWPQHGAIQDTKAKPKKIEEVHQEAAQEQAGGPALAKRKSSSTVNQKSSNDPDKSLKEIIRRKLVITTSSLASKPTPPPVLQHEDKPSSTRSRGGKAARAKKEKTAADVEEDSATQSTDVASTPASRTDTPRASASSAEVTPINSPVMPCRMPASPVPASTPPVSAPQSPATELPASEPATPEPLVLEPEPMPFNLAAFHRELAPLLRKLGRSAAAIADAIKSICEQDVPVCFQAKEFADILTRAAEENNGPRRRAAFQVAAGLAAAEGRGAFRPKECISGVAIFCREVYQDLCDEVTRLDLIVSAEMLPALRKTLSPEELLAVLPEDLRSS